jgi:SAM-dependent methyltransferase
MADTDDVASPDLYGERWADVYDDEYSSMVPPDEQLELLAELADGGPALELGIGTGRIALPLVARGVDVSGLDASPSMIERLRAKPGGDAIPVTIGDMANCSVAGTFRLVFVVFNTLFGLLTQEEQVACFANVARVLEPGGVFCIECFVPDPGRFARGPTLRTMWMTLDDVSLHAGKPDPVTQQVSVQDIHIGSDGISIRPIRLRYAWPAELDLMAQLAGLRLEHRWGGWNRQRFDAASTTHVSVYGSGR